MKPSSFLPLLFLLQIFFLTSIPISNSQVPAFNKYILAFQFTKSLCNNPIFNKCDPNWNKDLPNEFTIHGLWDNQCVGTKTASGKQLLLSEIYSNATLRDGLYQSWVDAHVIYTPGGNKDGERRAAADQYFKTTYDLFTNVGDILYELFKGGGLIYPDPFLKCITNTLNEEFLWEIELLYDRASLSILNHYRTDWRLTCSMEIVSLRQSGYNDQKDIMD
ncbi:hypothetical protein MKW98_025105 [Papaver atlanticum]|uniref:Uncharacterized protein n=1 Tax=Papaver atlanticum TaxID=357466 RepID=A0AAD4S194_9MAGN|nr:hypothetical protein MKW98_025105 [Papaver atlanticum]